MSATFTKINAATNHVRRGPPWSIWPTMWSITWKFCQDKHVWNDFVFNSPLDGCGDSRDEITILGLVITHDFIKRGPSHLILFVVALRAIHKAKRHSKFALRIEFWTDSFTMWNRLFLFLFLCGGKMWHWLERRTTSDETN